MQTHAHIYLVVTRVVDDAGAVDEVDALHQRDVLPHLRLAWICRCVFVCVKVSLFVYIDG